MYPFVGENKILL